jgi:hypothetical protein
MSVLLAVGLALAGQEPSGPYAAWPNGPPQDPAWFPLAVWLQNPSNAEAYRAAGINTYVGLYRGPTDEQMQKLKAAGMKVICHLNDEARKRLDDPAFIAWMHGDEPDNAQARRGGGYGPPLLPAKIVEDYERLRKSDPSRPIFLNLGQGVAWDDWIGRGVRTRHPEDYPEYLKGCDIASFDIYPAVHEHPAVAGQLWFVPQGVERLRKWTDGRKPVWNCVEASRIDNVKTKPTPAQVRSEVWMSIVAGSRGIIYFVHQFQPTFVEASLLRDPELLAAVTEINRQVRELAPVINSPALADGATVTGSDPAAPLTSTSRRRDGALYVFVVGLRDKAAKATVTAPGAKAEVLNENRTIDVRDGRFEDDVPAYGVRLYRIR